MAVVDAVEVRAAGSADDHAAADTDADAGTFRMVETNGQIGVLPITILTNLGE
jgi:hypothetical protein